MKNQSSLANRASAMWIIAGVLIAVLVLFLSPFSAYAQNYAGAVRGAVTDPSGAAVPGATVKLRDVGTNASTETTTTETGTFSFGNVSVGTYELTITAGNFKEYLAKDVEVHVSTTTEVNARLHLGAATEVISVEASDIQVQTTTADVGAR